ncbi:borealin [Aplysia californica]|uniref:Borealin n=1 Tax=Aplysia californica TaxID=6500 RepID=A0ABM0JDM3_APLCA|nr:borealin [Aplysia californica]XP_005091264.1 borealin [Aplysia californica]
MPRKRATRVKTANIPKPSTGISKSLTEKELREKKEQLELHLKEIDVKVKTYLKGIEKTKRTTILFLRGRYQDLIASYGPEVRNMTMKEFTLAGGTLASATSFVKQKTALKPTNSRLAEVQHLLCTAPSGGLELVAEEDSEDFVDQKEAEVKMPSKTPGTKQRGTKRVKSAMPPPSTRRSKRSVNATPLNTINRNHWGQTPLITPKFDPNLPSTPDNIREMKPGERLMSIAGSPVQVDNRRRAIGVVGAKKDKIKDELSEMELTPTKMERIFQLFSASLEKN